jgi:hypothetical protein
MSKTLTKGELLDLLGTPQVERQKEILAGMGITAFIRADGTLGVTWEVVNARMLGKTAESAPAETAHRQLNMSRMNA